MSYRYDFGNVPFRATVLTRPGRGEGLWLRWREGGNWIHRRIRETLASLGQAGVERIAREKVRDLLAAAPEDQRPPAPQLTLLEGLQLLLDPARGPYPTPSAHRAEVARELERVARMLENPPWALLGRGELTALWRARILDLRRRGHAGHRGAELTIVRLLSAAAWLRDQGLIPAGACLAPRDWKKQLQRDWRQLAAADKDYEPRRPRHTPEELQKILAAAPAVDPRLGLLLALGAELRLGQVARLRRSAIDREHGTVTIHGKGDKRGVTVELTAGQRASLEGALEGYLRTLDLRWRHDLVDYPVFPGGRLVRGQAVRPDARLLSRAAIERWFRAAEQAAGIAKAPGRGWYGLRRAGVDGAKASGISREGLKELGGWSDTGIPDRIYADQEQKVARSEAARVRAKTRGEGVE